MAQERLLDEKAKAKFWFKFLRTEEEKLRGFTTDGKLYFETLHECQRFTILWQEMAKLALKFMHRAIQADYVTTWTRWSSHVAFMKKAERVPVTHLGEGHVGNEVAPLGSWPVHEEELPWHPALGMDGLLPALPRMWAHRNPMGEVVLEHPQKFNSFQAMIGGPIDTASWVIPGLVMAGAYLEGKARRRGRQPTPPSAIGQVLLSGMGTYVVLMTDKEVNDFERLNGLPGLEGELTKEHQSIRSWLQSTVTRQQSAASEARKETETLPVFRPNDARYARAKAAMQAAVAKERLAFAAAERAKLAFGRFPASIEVLRVSVEEGAALELTAMVELLTAIESRLRSRSNGGVYLMSRLGHGRAPMVGAALMGRLYGVRPREALERIQAAHDARASNKASGRPTPAPQTLQQVSVVEQLLATNEALYAATIHRDGAPTNQREVEFIYPKLRGRGAPVPLPPQRIARVLPAINAPEVAKEDDVLEGPPLRPVVRLPRLHCPAGPSNRDLRLTTVMEEESKGPFGPRMNLQAPNIGK